MLIAVATRSGDVIEVTFPSVEEGEEELGTNPDGELVPIEEGPSPIQPELKELVWGGGAFIVLLVLMRFWLYPKVKRGMDARYELIHKEEEGADTARASARAEVAEYEAQLASVRAEAHERVNAARRTLEAEREERLTAVNASINERRQAALAAAEAERDAARGDVESAAADVVARTVELATGRRPDDAVVRSAVADSMMEGAR